MIKKAIITLEIEYDDLEASAPKRWNWNELLDISENEQVRILNYREESKHE